ncbi:hypothetical protein N7536_001547 [Penicillium majusculum]|nr:hypothetical protein N7536_001547 [Penicillium majusculum]
MCDSSTKKNESACSTQFLKGVYKARQRKHVHRRQLRIGIVGRYYLDDIYTNQVEPIKTTDDRPQFTIQSQGYQ